MKKKIYVLFFCFVLKFGGSDAKHIYQSRSVASVAAVR